MNEVTGHPVLQVARAGVLDGGQRVHFTFQFADGQEGTFLLPVEGLGKFILSLSKLGIMAQDERRKAGHADETIVTTAPLHAETFDLGLSNTRNGLLLRIRTQEQIPIDLDMSLEIAQVLADGLQTVLQETPPRGPIAH